MRENSLTPAMTAAVLFALLNAGCVAVVAAGALSSDRSTRDANFRRQATYRSYADNEASLTKAKEELEVRRACQPGAAAACGMLTETSWSACAVAACQTDGCRSRWAASLSTSLARRYFAADRAQIDAACPGAPARCSSVAAVEQSFFASHNQRVGLYLEATRVENKKQFDAGDPFAMNAFSKAMNDKLGEWRAQVRLAPECPPPPRDEAPVPSAPTPPPATPSAALHPEPH